VTLTPVRDNIIEGLENITFQLLPPQLAGHDYTIGSPLSGSATISDDVAEVILTEGETMAAEAGQVPADFTVSRNMQGNFNTTLRVYLEMGGTALINTDYAPTNLTAVGGSTYYVTIPTSMSSITVTLTPVRDNIIEGLENITFQLLPPQLAGHDYTIGSP
jgi:serralysin